MIHLPLYLEKKLKELFSRQQDRNDFVTKLVKEALENMEETYADNKKRRDEMTVGGTLHLFTDGGSRGNPGQAAVGCVLIDPGSGNVIEEHGEQIGIETNNVAEYQALIRGLEMAHEYHPNQLVCHLDSELVVKQLNGEYKVKMPTLQPLVSEIQTLVNNFTNVQFVHIPRSDNHLADSLVNKVLDGAL